ncbi:DUF3052 family protein [Sphingomonas parva]|uniref:DUF3052 family protein n=1 Tax=Sphingomonas parva TaxID=2555898 RepID=A0A4Y8ZR34_9SPHN|nr:DUF3052 family protein [Sphingomonas parva]TFI57927.1 DUF3052 family protein [Sphingomonas parva]
MATGYSGTPLAKKLTLKDGQRIWWENMPVEVQRAIAASGVALECRGAAEAPIDAAHVFVTTRVALEEAVERLRPLLAPDGMLWVSWPKKASRVPSEVSEDLVRAVALPTGLVDVKVCAVDETWSGLKLVIRKALRQ